MRKLHTRRGGFTLIELMIVVAIIGILAAIAIPNFLQFQLRSKTGEAKTNLAAMRTAEEGYFAEYGVYVGPANQSPAGAPTASKRQWPDPAVASTRSAGAPRVRCSSTTATTSRARVVLARRRGRPRRRRSHVGLRLHPPGCRAADRALGPRSVTSCANTGVYNAATQRARPARTRSGLATRRRPGRLLVHDLDRFERAGWLPPGPLHFPCRSAEFAAAAKRRRMPRSSRAGRLRSAFLEAASGSSSERSTQCVPAPMGEATSTWHGPAP